MSRTKLTLHVSSKLSTWLPCSSLLAGASGGGPAEAEADAGERFCRFGSLSTCKAIDHNRSQAITSDRSMNTDQKPFRNTHCQLTRDSVIAFIGGG